MLTVVTDQHSAAVCVQAVDDAGYSLGAWLSTFSRDAMRIMCLSLAGRWWRAELRKRVYRNRRQLVVPAKCFSTPRHLKYLIPSSTTEAYKYSFYPRKIRIWNNMPHRLLSPCQLHCPAFKEVALYSIREIYCICLHLVNFFAHPVN